MSDEQLIWVEDRTRRVLGPGEEHRCSSMRCEAPAVMVFTRASVERRGRRYWRQQWCCAEHAYGRRVKGGRVLVQVHPDSPTGRQGYVDR